MQNQSQRVSAMLEVNKRRVLYIIKAHIAGLISVYKSEKGPCISPVESGVSPEKQATETIGADL